MAFLYFNNILFGDSIDVGLLNKIIDKHYRDGTCQ